MPVNPLPWHAIPGRDAIYDINGAVVSFRENAHFLMAAANFWHERNKGGDDAHAG